jgi:hypothetical protein
MEDVMKVKEDLPPAFGWPVTLYLLLSLKLLLPCSKDNEGQKIFAESEYTY